MLVYNPKQEKTLNDLINIHGGKCLNSEEWKYMENVTHHGIITRAEHCKNVAIISLKLANILFKNKINIEELIFVALMHDAFMYDWKNSNNKFHAFTHPKDVINTLEKKFDLSKREKNAILSHMFPCSFYIPKYKESIIICIADKISAIEEYSREQNFIFSFVNHRFPKIAMLFLFSWRI